MSSPPAESPDLRNALENDPRRMKTQGRLTMPQPARYHRRTLRTTRLLLPAGLAALVAVALAAAAYTPPPNFRTDVNPQPSTTCRNCHLDITEQWLSSAHARADRTKNLLFGRMYFYSLKETRGATLTKCGPCHETMSFVQNDYEVPRLREANGEGVTCSFCHAIDAKGPAEAVPPAELDLQKYYGTIRGPVSNNTHLSGFAEIYQGSDYCGLCHRYSNQYGVPISDPIGEWRKTRYAKQGVTCQACHMPGGPGRNSVDGPVRPRVANHSFALDPGLNAKLKGAVTLRLTSERRGADSLRVYAVVTNAGAGHSLPTGNDQKMLLVRVRVLTESGSIVWENDPFQEWSVSVFSLLLEDDLGQWPAETWTARKVLVDRRIPAGQAARVYYDVPLQDKSGPFKVEAQVLFRTGRPATLAAYGLDESLWGAERVMAESTLRVP
jgi:nitrate/TMAO reductase-like tetraheme cytochrome c subunit